MGWQLSRGCFGSWYISSITIFVEFHWTSAFSSGLRCGRRHRFDFECCQIHVRSRYPIRTRDFKLQPIPPTATAVMASVRLTCAEIRLAKRGEHANAIGYGGSPSDFRFFTHELAFARNKWMDSKAATHSKNANPAEISGTHSRPKLARIPHPRAMRCDGNLTGCVCSYSIGVRTRLVDTHCGQYRTAGFIFLFFC
jgi:hypothetical protein